MTTAFREVPQILSSSVTPSEARDLPQPVVSRKQNFSSALPSVKSLAVCTAGDEHAFDKSDWLSRRMRYARTLAPDILRACTGWGVIEF